MTWQPPVAQLIAGLAERVRTWGARGLLHVWDDNATAAVSPGSPT